MRLTLRHDLASGGDFGDRARRHEAVLQIDHDMGSLCRCQAVEYAEPAAPLGNAPTTMGLIAERCMVSL